MMALGDMLELELKRIIIGKNGFILPGFLINWVKEHSTRQSEGSEIRRIKAMTTTS